MKRKVRIKDIADKAGVSTGTVDRVLHKRGNVSEAVRKRVLEVVEELGYERNLLASALAYNRIIPIVAVLPDPTKDPYWEQLNKGVEHGLKVVKHYGMSVSFYYFDYSEPKSFERVAEEALATQPAGMLFPPMFAQEANKVIHVCDEGGTPYVFINTNFATGTPLSYIGQDSMQSGVLGARLLDFGLSPGQTACILSLDYSTKAAQHLKDKEQGFRSYFEEIGNKEVQIIRHNFEAFDDDQQLADFLNDLLRQHPSLSGFFITNSRAHKAIDALSQIGATQVKLVGFDLIDKNINYLRANKIDFLINQNPMEQGFQGIVSLFKHLILKEKVKPVQYLPLDIVVKENTDYYLKREPAFQLVG